MFVINNKFWQAIEYKECEKKNKEKHCPSSDDQ